MKDAVSPSDTGALYAVFGRPRYKAGAVASLLSLKKHAPKMPVAICTDEPAFFAPYAGHIDHLIEVQSGPYFGERWVSDKFPRMGALCRTPFEQTLYLDADTRVHSSKVAHFSNILSDNEIAFVECSRENSYTRRRLDRPLFNAGVILYRSSPGVFNLFAEWQSLCADYHAGRYNSRIDVETLFKNQSPEQQNRLLRLDQVPLMHLLSPEANVFHLKVGAVPEAWNFKRRTLKGLSLDDVIISHHKDYVREAEALLADGAIFRTSGPAQCRR